MRCHMIEFCQVHFSVLYNHYVIGVNEYLGKQIP